jgi:hypothetical protein
MATIKKVSKAKNLSAGPSKMTKKAGPVDPKGQYTKVQERTLGSMKMGGKMKKGGSFPDLNKDGKITKADILKGRGVIAKKGMKVKKAQDGKTVKQSNADMMKEIAAREKRIAARDSANQKKSYTNERANKVIGKNKMGGKTKKCMTGCK